MASVETEFCSAALHKTLLLLCPSESPPTLLRICSIFPYCGYGGELFTPYKEKAKIPPEQFQSKAMLQLYYNPLNPLTEY